MWGILIALISGALMSIQGVFNTGVTKTSGMWLTNSFVQLSGFAVCIIAWLIAEKNKYHVGTLLQVDNKYMLLGGVIGAAITFTVMQSMSKLGPCQAVLLIVVAQVGIAYLIELLGWFDVDKADFSWRRLAGLLVAIVGIVMFRWES